MSVAVEQFTCETVPLAEWESLRSIFNDEFNSDLPHYKYGHILGLKDEDGEMIGFVSLESVLLVSQVYLRQDHRHSDARKVLFGSIEDLMKKQTGRSALIITEDTKASRQMKRYGLRERGRAWRIDF